jgi:hypothetical protein
MRTTIAEFVKQEDAINAWIKDYDNMCSLVGPDNIRAFSPSAYYEYVAEIGDVVSRYHEEEELTVEVLTHGRCHWWVQQRVRESNDPIVEHLLMEV